MSRLHFYYDESNNIRAFRIKTDGINADFNSNINEDFVLGGVVSETACDVSFNEIKTLLKLQNNVNELKFKKHFPKKSFLDCVNSDRLEALLKWIFEKGLYIHYIHVNNLFYALADIIDSMPEAIQLYRYGQEQGLNVKSALFAMVENKTSELAQIFYTYKYPNIEKGNEKAFCEAMLHLTAQNTYEPTEALVRILLTEGKNSKELTFIQDNKDYEMQEDFSMFYAHRILLFKNDIHIFDKELSIQPQIENTCRILGGTSVSCFEFVDSKDSVLVQISDVLVGVIGKMYAYINKSNQNTIDHDICCLNSVQRRNISLIDQLMIRSNSKHREFFQHVAAAHKRELEGYMFYLNRKHM